MLRIGSYDLFIDNILIGNFSGSNLSSGVDLAQIATTPQYQQSLKVKSALEVLWKAEGELKWIKQIEFYDLKDFPAKNDILAARKYLNDIAPRRHRCDLNFKKQVDNYFTSKPKIKELEDRLELLRERVYQLSAPQNHFFKIVRHS